MSGASKVLKAMAVLENAGYQQPKAVKDYVLNEDRKNRGVKQVWGCDKCPYEYESMIKVSSTVHECNGLKSKGSHALKLVKEF